MNKEKESLILGNISLSNNIIYALNAWYIYSAEKILLTPTERRTCSSKSFVTNTQLKTRSLSALSYNDVICLSSIVEVDV